MAVLLFPLFQAIDGNGDPIAGAKLYFYTTGTSTPQDTYTTSALSTPNTNPVVADADGRFGPIYGGTTDYKAILKTAADVTIETLDPLLVPTSQVITTEGDLIIGDSNDQPSRLPIGAADRVLLSSGTTASWEQIDLASSGVLSGILSKDKGGLGSEIAAPAVSVVTAYSSNAGVIPVDDTIPQNTEGVELVTLAYTAATATNRIRVTCKGYFAARSGLTETLCLALFMDSETDAKRSAFFSAGNFTVHGEVIWEGVVAAGAHTWKIRGGGSADGIMVNGSGGRFGGGSAGLVLIIEELPTT